MRFQSMLIPYLGILSFDDFSSFFGIQTIKFSTFQIQTHFLREHSLLQVQYFHYPSISRLLAKSVIRHMINAQMCTFKVLNDIHLLELFKI